MFNRKKPGSKFLNPDALTFSMFSEEEIRKLSVVKITTPLSFNALGHPYKGGLYDPCLGPSSFSSDPCGTCFNDLYRCPGHFGHIELPIPAINSLFINVVQNILRLTCFNCYKLQIKGYVKHVYITKIKLLNEGLFLESQGVDEVVSEITGSVENDENATTMDIFVINAVNNYYLKCIKGRKKEDAQKTQKTRIVELLINSTLHAMDKLKYLEAVCCHCQNPLKKLRKIRKKFMTNIMKPEEEGVEDSVRLITTLVLPNEIRDILREAWKVEKEFIMAFVPVLRDSTLEHPTDVFFINVIAVPPPKMRPINMLNGKLVEHSQSEGLKLILQDTVVIQNVVKALQSDGDTSDLPIEGWSLLDQMQGKTLLDKLNHAYEEMQNNINNFIDYSGDNRARKLNIGPGIKQVIEKKEGVVRMHMMGKRVNYAARTVITPDPYLNVEEIGVPEVFALNLTYPVYVTTWNVKELQKMVLNGPNVHPGAVLIENEDGSIRKISGKDKCQRVSLAKCLLTPATKHTSRKMKIVHRHLCNGDILLLNRQPTLHKPGIMAHVAKILKGERTFRLHYANCKSYNADFDGDEMNAHFPQNEIARSEAYNILNVQNQYMVPKDGTPLSGLIQDHVVSGVRLSVRGQFFGRDDYQQLVYQALCNKQKEIKLLPPAILKPRALWSGKQIISTVIINIIPEDQHPLNLTSYAKISDKAWTVHNPRHWKAGGTPFTKEHSMSEAEVIIREGQLLCGVLDKKHYGATPYGLVHCMNELYGGSSSCKLLSAFSKLFNYFLQQDGFTLGIEDILVKDYAEKERASFITESRRIGDMAVKRAVELPETASLYEMREKMEEMYIDKDKGRAIIDNSYKEMLDKYTNNINRSCIPGGLHKRFPYNNLQLMIQSGAKGSTVNAMQISCLLGQIELEGRRPPPMISGKRLPSFARFDTSPKSGGFIDGRFLTGIKPQDFFYHCMAGREGLIDTCVKTSRSGYLQRCLVKHLEGLVVAYDTSVRDSDGSVIQYCYGEDGKDVLKSQFLKKSQIPFLAENCKAVINASKELIVNTETSEELTQRQKEIHKWIKLHGDPLIKTRTSPFLFYSENIGKVPSKKLKKIKKGTGRSKGTRLMCDMWRDADTETIESCNYESRRCADPVTAVFQVDRDFGALTEQLENLMTDYLNSRSKKKKSLFKQMMSVKSLQSCVHPGEPVGILAAQSIGEPSTQMTLNTFHFAGRGEMNVTLGIPRLRELLMSASKTIKTPYMDVPFRMDVSGVEKKSKQLKMKLHRVTLADLLQYIEVTDKITVDNKYRGYCYELHFQFLPRETYKSKFKVKPPYIMEYMEKKFFCNMFFSLKKEWKVKDVMTHTEEEKSRRANRRGGGGDDDDDDFDPDDPDGNIEELPDLELSTTGNIDKDDASSEDETNAGDEDATAARRKMRKTDCQEYEESEDDVYDSSDDEDEEVAENEKKDQPREANDFTDTDDESHFLDNQLLNGSLSSDVKQKAGKVLYDLRRNKVITSIQYIVDYDYDEKDELWCKVKILMPLSNRRLDLTAHLKELASKCVIWEAPMIKQAFTYTSPETQNLVLKTEGINFLEIFKYYELLDLNKIYSNDVHAMATTYGIEAARRVIVKEIQHVFKVYGIVVDPRHLLLVADYMTFDGTVQPFSRLGLADNPSPLQQMSYESAMAFLKSAIRRGKRDELQSPSSRLMIGQPAKVGTACFSLLQRLPHVKSFNL